MFTLPPTDTHTHELGSQCVYVMATSVSIAFQYGKKNQSNYPFFNQSFQWKGKKMVKKKEKKEKKVASHTKPVRICGSNFNKLAKDFM